MPKCKITGYDCPAWSDFDGCGLEICRFKLNGLAANRKHYIPPTAEVVPITNEMHLHSLGSEALAAFLAEFESGSFCKGDPRCEADLEEDRLIPIERCHECALAWLKAPYVPKEAADA